MISKNEIENFNKKFDVVSAFIEYDGEILLLLRQDHKPQGDTWSMVAGKVSHGESLVDALVREIKEEIGLRIQTRDCKYFETYYVRYPKYDYLYHVYHISLERKPSLNLNLEENKEYQWIKPKDALNLNLIEDEDVCIKWFYAV